MQRLNRPMRGHNMLRDGGDMPPVGVVRLPDDVKISPDGKKRFPDGVNRSPDGVV